MEASNNIGYFTAISAYDILAKQTFRDRKFDIKPLFLLIFEILTSVKTEKLKKKEIETNVSNLMGYITQLYFFWIALAHKYCKMGQQTKNNNITFIL